MTDLDDLITKVRKDVAFTSADLVANILEAARDLLSLVDRIDINEITAADTNDFVDPTEVIEKREAMRATLDNLVNMQEPPR